MVPPVDCIEKLPADASVLVRAACQTSQQGARLVIDEQLAVASVADQHRVGRVARPLPDLPGGNARHRRAGTRWLVAPFLLLRS